MQRRRTARTDSDKGMDDGGRGGPPPVSAPSSSADATAPMSSPPKSRNATKDNYQPPTAANGYSPLVPSPGRSPRRSPLPPVFTAMGAGTPLQPSPAWGAPSFGDTGKETPLEIVLATLRRVGADAAAGCRDSMRLERSWGLVWGDAELRTLVLKVTLVNLLSLTLLSLFPLVLRPLFRPNAAGGLVAVQEVGFWYDVLLNWPLFAVCFWVNALWGPAVAKRAQSLLHPTHRHQPTTTTGTAPSATPAARAWMLLTRVLLIADFNLVSRILRRIPLLGKPSGMAYICLINAYYAYESVLVSRGPLEFRCKYVSARTAYMVGFGLVPTLLTSYGPPLVNMAVFALLYPFYLIQALQSRPPSGGGAGPTGVGLLTPSPGASAPGTPTQPGFAASSTASLSSISSLSRIGGVPLFWFARRLLDGLQELGAALARRASRDTAVDGRGRKLY